MVKVKLCLTYVTQSYTRCVVWNEWSDVAGAETIIQTVLDIICSWVGLENIANRCNACTHYAFALCNSCCADNTTKNRMHILMLLDLLCHAGRSYLVGLWFKIRSDKQIRCRIACRNASKSWVQIWKAPLLYWSLTKNLLFVFVVNKQGLH